MINQAFAFEVPRAGTCPYKNRKSKESNIMDFK
jgi:hypothetical protein